MFVLALMGHQDAGEQEVLHILLPHAFMFKQATYQYRWMDLYASNLNYNLQ